MMALEAFGGGVKSLGCPELGDATFCNSKIIQKFDTLSDSKTAFPHVWARVRVF